MIRSLLALVALLTAIPTLASAQTVRVVAGEHADFTRLVLRVPPDLDWSMGGAGARRIFETGRDVSFDLTTLFDRIPRARLASAQEEPQGLVLDLACDCPVRAWLDRPGLVVIDISDPGPAGEVATPPEPARPQQAPRLALDLVGTARGAGERLAREHAERTARDDSPGPALDQQDLAGLAEDLSRQFAQALGQGLLDAPVQGATRSAVLRPDGSEADLPANMRIVDVTERPVADTPPAPAPDPACRGTEALDFLIDRAGPGFTQGLSQYGQTLFEEFDQPSESGFLNLVQHYLAAGLGAEARALISNLRDPLPGRDILLGFSDVLEGRMSNSRVRLAQAAGCGGAAAIGAVLAQPQNRELTATASELALSFGRLPTTLQSALGPELVRVLTGAGALDEARVVADALRQSPWTPGDDIRLVDARLEEGRGAPDRAASHLDSIAMRSIEGTLAWLDLALSQGTLIAPSALDDAEALATENRVTESGLAIMAATIRLRARSAGPDSALVALDRLESWTEGQGNAQALVTPLRDEIWSALAGAADDHDLLALTLARSDWLDPGLSLPTRQALAARLVELGFARAADRLLAPESDASSLRLRARAALQQDEPQTAMQLIGPDPSVEAVDIRAASASRAGQHAEAAALLDAAGRIEAAASAAILDGDWRRLDDLQARGAVAPTVPPDAVSLLGQEPGIAELVLSAQPATAAGNATRATTPPGAAPTEGATPSPDPAPPITASGQPPPDPAEVLDRMGMVSRAGLLLAESERLRQAVSLTIQAPGQP